MIDDEDNNNVFDDGYNRLLVCQKGETGRNPFCDDIVEVRSSRHGPGASLLNERGVSLQCVSDSCANHNSGQ